MKKKILMSMVLLAIVTVSAVFAQQPTLDKLKFIESKAGYTAIPVNKDISGEVVIPDTYNGKPVITVGDFSDLPAITGITVPNSVTTINSYSFRNTSISAVNIPAGVKQLYGRSFKGCNKLTSVTFGGNDTVMDEDSNKYLGDLRAKYQAGGPGTYTRQAGSNTWARRGGATTQQPMQNKLRFAESRAGYTANPINKDISGEVVIPGTYNGKPVIGVGDFSNLPAITGITVPNSVTTINSFSFRNTSISAVNIPAGVNQLYGRSFIGCDKLTSVTFGGSNTVMDEDINKYLGDLRAKYQAGGPGTYTRQAGSNTWTRLGGVNTAQPLQNKLRFAESKAGYTANPANKDISGEVVIPGTYNGKPVIAVGDFSNISGITSVTMPNSVTTIVSTSFKNTGITSITISAGVTQLYGRSFIGCNKLVSVTFAGDNTIMDDDSNKYLGDLRFNYQAKGPGTYTRQAGSNTWTKSGSDSQAAPWKQALRFVDGKNGYTVHAQNKDISGDVAIFATYNNKPVIAVGDFSNISGITSVIIPNSVTSISPNAFQGSGIIKVFIPPNFEGSLRGSMFSGCQALKNIIFMGKDTKIDDSSSTRNVLGDLRIKYQGGGSGTYMRRGDGSWTKDDLITTASLGISDARSLLDYVVGGISYGVISFEEFRKSSSKLESLEEWVDRLKKQNAKIPQPIMRDNVYNEIVSTKAAENGLYGGLAAITPGVFAIAAECAKQAAQWAVKAELSYAIACLYNKKPANADVFKGDLYQIFAGPAAVRETMKDVGITTAQYFAEAGVKEGRKIFSDPKVSNELFMKLGKKMLQNADIGAAFGFVSEFSNKVLMPITAVKETVGGYSDIKGLGPEVRNYYFRLPNPNGHYTDSKLGVVLLFKKDSKGSENSGSVEVKPMLQNKDSDKGVWEVVSRAVLGYGKWERTLGSDYVKITFGEVSWVNSNWGMARPGKDDFYFQSMFKYSTVVPSFSNTVRECVLTGETSFRMNQGKMVKNEEDGLMVYQEGDGDWWTPEKMVYK